MTANSPFSSSRSASSPESAVTTSASGSSTSDSASRLRSSSSTTSMRARASPSAALGARRLPDRARPGAVIDSAAVAMLPAAPASVRPGLGAADPHPQQRQQQVDVDRLGDVVRRAGVEAFLPVALHRLGGDRDQRDVRQLRARADPLHRLVAVHLGHHDVDQRDVDAGSLLEDRDALGAALGVEHFGAVRLEHAGQRVDVADVVVDDEHLRAGQLGHACAVADAARPCGAGLRRLRLPRDASRRSNEQLRPARRGSAGFSITPARPA